MKECAGFFSPQKQLPNQTSLCECGGKRRETAKQTAMYRENEFLKALSQSFKNYLEYGSRSPEKLKPIHRFLAETLHSIFGEGYEAHYLGENSKEFTIEGKYYPKDIDVTITHNGKPIFCLGVKFVTSNYKQNVNNYFEGMMGETANIQRQSIPYAQVIVLRYETPYYKKSSEKQKDKVPEKMEIVNQRDLSKYVKLAFDMEQAHRPFAIGILVVKIDKKTGRASKVKPDSFLEQDFSEVLENKASISNLFKEVENFAKFYKSQL